MIKFFKDAYIYQYVVVVFTAAVLWLPGFLTSESCAADNVPDAPLYNMFSYLFEFSPFVKRLFALLTLIALSFFFNSLLSLNQLIPHSSSIGSFLFVLLLSSQPEITEFHPFLLALFPILAVINTIFLIYHTKNPELYLLNTGLFIALASMVYFPSIWLLLWILIAIRLFAERDIRNYLIPFFGFAIPYAIYFAICYITGDLSEQLSAYSYSIHNYSISFASVSLSDYVFFGVLALLLIINYISGSHVMEKTVVIRKKITCSRLLYIFAFFMLFATTPIMQNGLMLLVAAMMFSVVLGNLRKSRFANVVMIIVVVAVLVNQYYGLVKQLFA